MALAKIKSIQLPLKEPMADEKGNISPLWRNALIDLQTAVNELLKRENA